MTSLLRPFPGAVYEEDRRIEDRDRSMATMAGWYDDRIEYFIDQEAYDKIMDLIYESDKNKYHLIFSNCAAFAAAVANAGQVDISSHAFYTPHSLTRDVRKLHREKEERLAKSVIPYDGLKNRYAPTVVTLLERQKNSEDLYSFENDK